MNFHDQQRFSCDMCPKVKSSIEWCKEINTIYLLKTFNINFNFINDYFLKKFYK